MATIGITHEQSERIDALKETMRRMREAGTPMPQDIVHANTVQILGGDDF